MGRGKFPPGVLAAVRPSPESDLVPSLGSLAAVRQSPAQIIALCLSADRFARLSTVKLDFPLNDYWPSFEISKDHVKELGTEMFTCAGQSNIDLDHNLAKQWT